MKRILVCALLVICAASCIAVINAQSLPYTATYTWDISPDAQSYNCYLDGKLVINVTTNTCQVSIATLGDHVASVTVVNNTFLPPESDPTTLNFKLQSPGKSGNLKIR